MNIGQLLSLPELRDELTRVDEALRASVLSDDPFLSEVAAHLIVAGGKRLRPSMAIAAALIRGNPPIGDKVIQAAAAVELVHLGSLYHDDVLDGASLRRTVPSVNAQYGNFMAIIAGDYLLAKASLISATLGGEVPGLLAKTIAELCEGQVWEQRYAYNSARSVAAYEACISGKTASLIATAARMGAITAGLSAVEIDALTTYGYCFGMAFQIRDDILDIVWTDDQLGKPAGNDLIEGVYTLPVIYALEEEVGPELRQLLTKKITLEQRDAAREIVRTSAGVSNAIDSGQAWAKQANDALSVFEGSPLSQQLSALAVDLFVDL